MRTYRITFEIPGLPEPTNRLNSMTLGQRIRRNEYWKQQVWIAVGSKKPPAPLAHARLVLTRFSSTAPDPDGLVSSFKHIIDGLVVCKILLNDRVTNIGMPDYRWEKVSPKQGKIRVEVEQVISVASEEWIDAANYKGRN